ncbi:ABC transporter substrate-binding protein [Bradyrhizobium prioriisuperbiae]|uniref:ABC transporter substrate-binding protein n=1 Tax=Bradyrhizobium prioriisuperbiae TaxID=2854389 RepID=UPI0028EA922E|nr:ABC transporter substrate-binding protein [Bradyrhizobium prioritasuperba]
MPPAAAPPRIVTMLVDPEPTTLLALSNCADPTMLVSGKIHEGLLSYDFDLTPRPQLALDWSTEPSGLQLTFRLRPGVRWHDGTPFTSEDVAFSLMLLKQLHPRGRSTFANVTEVETPDPLTVVIHLSRPAPALLRALAGAESPMIPRHRYADRPPSASDDRPPIGTGPFVFLDWVKGSHVTLARNPDYWDAPHPAIDRLVIRFIDDQAERLAAIESGAINIAPATPVSVTALDRLSRNERLIFETNGYQYTNQVIRLEFNLDHPVVGKYEVRRAIAHAIDRNVLVAQAWMGYGKVAYGPISPDLKPYGEDIPAVPHLDHGEADRWLDAAGFPRNDNGLRFALPLDFVPAGDGYQRTADTIATALAEIGIDVTVRQQDFPGYVRRLYTDRDFAFAVARSNNMFDPSVGVQRIYWSHNFRKGVPFSNGSHYANSEADRLLEQASVEQDAAERRRLYRDFQARVAEDLPDITLLAPTQITIVDRHLTGHTLSADGTNGSFAELRIVG